MRLQSFHGHRTNHTLHCCVHCERDLIGADQIIPIEDGTLSTVHYSLNKKKRWQTAESLRKTNEIVEIASSPKHRNWRQFSTDDQEPIALAVYSAHKSHKMEGSIPAFKSICTPRRASADSHEKSRGKGKGKNKPGRSLQYKTFTLQTL